MGSIFSLSARFYWIFSSYLTFSFQCGWPEAGKRYGRGVKERVIKPGAMEEKAKKGEEEEEEKRGNWNIHCNAPRAFSLFLEFYQPPSLSLFFLSSFSLFPAFQGCSQRIPTETRQHPAHPSKQQTKKTRSKSSTDNGESNEFDGLNGVPIRIHMSSFFPPSKIFKSSHGVT